MKNLPIPFPFRGIIPAPEDTERAAADAENFPDALPQWYGRLATASERLNEAAIVASRDAWELEMLLRDVRLARTETERNRALDRLRKLGELKFAAELNT